MSKRQVVEIECSRCDRKEYRQAAETEGGSDVSALVVTLTVGEECSNIVFQDLCTPCTTTIKGHLAAVAKKIEGLSPMRTKKTEKEVVEVTPKKVNGTKKEKDEVDVSPLLPSTHGGHLTRS